MSDNGGCSEFADCSNTVGSFTCTCWDRYFGDGFSCSGRPKLQKCFLYETQFDKIIDIAYFSKYTVSKNDINVAHYNFMPHQLIVVILGRDVTESTLSNGELLSHLS